MNAPFANVARILLPLAAASVMSACATTIPPNLNTAANSASSAATTANSVNREIREAVLMDLVTQSSPPSAAIVPAAWVCSPVSGSATLTAKELGAFADSINAVGKVSAKPSDTSYAGYLAQFKKDHDASAAAAVDQDAVDKKDAADTLAAQTRCLSLLQADLNAKLSGPVMAGGGSVTAITATVVAIDNLIKALLAAGEQIKREQAVHATMTHMVVVLRAAADKLGQPPPATDYILASPAGDPSSRLSNTLSIHRWFAAQRLQVDWTRVLTARGSNWRTLEAADIFVADVDAYVALSSVDPTKLLKGLNDAVAKAVTANDKTSLVDIFDNLSAIGGALSSVDGKYSAFRKTL